MYTPPTVYIRTLEEIKALKLTELSAAEIYKLQNQDPEAYRAAAEALDGPTPVVEPGAPQKRVIYRNGQEVTDTSPIQSFKNGVLQE